MNQGDLISTVKLYLNRPDLPGEEVALWIPVVEGELNVALVEHPSNLRRVTIAQLSGDALVPVPDDLVHTYTLRVDGSNTVYEQFPFTAREKAQNSQPSFIARGSVMEVFPTPSVDTTFQLDYGAVLSPLTDNASTNWVLTKFSDVYLYGMLKEAAVYLKDNARLQSWTAEFVRRLQSVAGQGWNQSVASNPRIRNIR